VWKLSQSICYKENKRDVGLSKTTGNVRKLQPVKLLRDPLKFKERNFSKNMAINARVQHHQQSPITKRAATLMHTSKITLPYRKRIQSLARIASPLER